MVFSYILLHFGFWMFFDILHVGFFPVKSAPAKKSISALPVGAMEWSEAWSGMSQEGVDGTGSSSCRGGGGRNFFCCLFVGWVKILMEENARKPEFGILTFLFFGHFQWIFPKENLEAFGSFSVEWLWAWPWLRPVAWISLDFVSQNCPRYSVDCGQTWQDLDSRISARVMLSLTFVSGRTVPIGIVHVEFKTRTDSKAPANAG